MNNTVLCGYGSLLCQNGTCMPPAMIRNAYLSDIVTSELSRNSYLLIQTDGQWMFLHNSVSQD